MPSYFNSRPSARGDQPIPSHAREVLRFQFTPLREGRLADADVVFQRFHEFQFTPLREGRPPAYTRIEMIQLFQFTPLREGRHFLPKKKISRGLISIHAPPRGATFCVNFLFKLVYFNSRPSARGDEIAEKQDMSAGISIHAPPRGATALSVQHQKRQVNFNSRPSARGDAVGAGTLVWLEDISIHAPPRGATRREMRKPHRGGISIHAPPRGATPRLGSILSALLHFNSRPSARGDSKRYAISANLLFNPYKSAWLNNNATQFVEIILVIFHRIIA